MRILLLTLLIVGPYFYFREDKVAYEEVEPKPFKAKEDAVKLKLMAPSRQMKAQEDAQVEPLVTDEETDYENQDESGRSPALEQPEDAQTEEVGWSDLEETWNQELKAMLNRLEPDEGDEIHKSYLIEKESFRAEMDALINEKNQKTSEDAIAEIDQLIAALDDKHQEKLKEILGAHYEAVRDHYDQFMEASQSQY